MPSLARFFDKAALAASQAIRDFDRASFEATLLASPVSLIIGDAAGRSREGQACAGLAVRLLARLYPVVTVEAEDSLRDHLHQTARSIHPGITLDSAEPPVATIVVGAPDSEALPGEAVFVGSNGWTASISTTSPRSVGETANPFGAGAAACFAAAAVFRSVFSDVLPDLPPIQDLTVSILRPWAEDPEADATEVPDADLEETHIVGLGAIGNAVVWALSWCDGLAGRLHLVDGEAVDLSNLQRYVLTSDADATDKTAKTALAERHLADSGLDAVPHDQHWDRYLNDVPDRTLMRVAVGVDSPEARVAVQASLPRIVLNAWTQSGDLGVSRHPDFLDAPCLACLYLPDGERPSYSHRVATEIGLPDQEPRIRGYIDRRKPVDPDLLSDIATANDIPTDELARYQGQPIDAFYAAFVCGGHRLRVGGAGPTREIDAPLAFQSALAGVLLAAEIVADAGGLRSADTPTLTRADVLSTPGVFESDTEPKGLQGRCICRDDDFRARYAEKYEVQLR